jgi:hypothetical protein
MSEAMTTGSHLRSSYYTKPSVFNLGIDFAEFIKTIDKTKPIIVHSHGCAGVTIDDYQLKNFYTELGFYFVMLDFHKRIDARPACRYISGSLQYNADPVIRMSARVRELKHHIQILKDNGIKTIYATGHSEGGMVIQRLDDEVELAIIHASFCSSYNNWGSKIQYLHLVSDNDPILSTLSHFGLRNSCPDIANYTVVPSSIRSHGPLADPIWKQKIKEFLTVNNTKI